MANIRYKYTFTDPNGAEYVAYSGRDLAEMTGYKLGQVTGWIGKGMSQYMLDKGAKFKKEKMRPLKYVYKEDGEIYADETLEKIAQQVYMSYQNISMMLKHGIPHHVDNVRELYCIDYRNNSVKYAGEPWQKITQEELEALDID